jgi:thiamine biosynthesis protein ThiI
MDIARRLGAGLNEGATVRLDDPQVEVGVEVHRRETLFYSEKIRGAGGLPLGVQNRALVLISGGFDSAVAAWYMMRRGVPCDFLFCNLAGAAYERSVLAVTRTLVDTWSHGYSPRLHIVDYSELVRQIQQKVTPRFAQVVLKRMFCRTGQKVAARIGASALVTGESVGQVSSQTLSNLQSIDAVATMPVLRPLLCFDKMEIIRLADRIGTGPLSAVIQEYCALVPDKPATRSTPEQVALQERHIDPDIIDHLVELASSRKVKQITERDLVAPYVHTDEITPASVVLDARPRSRYREWHYPDARHCDMPELIDSFKRLDKSKRYVLYCEVGVQTAVLAERMQREGYEAYSYRGGASALRRR